MKSHTHSLRTSLSLQSVCDWQPTGERWQPVISLNDFRWLCSLGRIKKKLKYKILKWVANCAWTERPSKLYVWETLSYVSEHEIISKTGKCYQSYIRISEIRETITWSLTVFIGLTCAAFTNRYIRRLFAPLKLVLRYINKQERRRRRRRRKRRRRRRKRRRFSVPSRVTYSFRGRRHDWRRKVSEFNSINLIRAVQHWIIHLCSLTLSLSYPQVSISYRWGSKCELQH